MPVLYGVLCQMRGMGIIMSIIINNMSYDYSRIIVKGIELEPINSVYQKSEDGDINKIAKVSPDSGSTAVLSYEQGHVRKDYFFTNYNDVVAQNYGLIFDIRV